MAWFGCSVNRPSFTTVLPLYTWFELLRPKLWCTAYSPTMSSKRLVREPCFVLVFWTVAQITVVWSLKFTLLCLHLCSTVLKLYLRISSLHTQQDPVVKLKFFCIEGGLTKLWLHEFLIIMSTTQPTFQRHLVQRWQCAAVLTGH